MVRIAEHFGFKVVTAPTSGSGESMQLVLGGHADVTLSGGVHVPQIKAGNLKAIAMLSGPARRLRADRGRSANRASISRC